MYICIKFNEKSIRFRIKNKNKRFSFQFCNSRRPSWIPKLAIVSQKVFAGDFYDIFILPVDTDS